MKSCYRKEVMPGQSARLGPGSCANGLRGVTQSRQFSWHDWLCSYYIVQICGVSSRADQCGMTGSGPPELGGPVA
jgi:hypothetical protein